MFRKTLGEDLVCLGGGLALGVLAFFDGQTVDSATITAFVGILFILATRQAALPFRNLEDDNHGILQFAWLYCRAGFIFAAGLSAFGAVFIGGPLAINLLGFLVSWLIFGGSSLAMRLWNTRQTKSKGADHPNVTKV